MGKHKKSLENADDDGSSKDVETEGEKVSWEDKIKHLSPISHPLATKRLTKKLYKTVKKAAKNNNLRRGIKEVQKCIKHGEKGIVVLAGDVSPMDIISHMPIVCEEAGLDYCFVPSKKELGEAYGSKRHVCMVLVKDHESYSEEFTECKTKISEIPRAY